MVRFLKIVLVAFVGLQGLLYFVGNIANWNAGRQAVGAVIGMVERPFYEQALLPAITAPYLVTAAFVTILAGELLVGILSLAGAAKMIGALGAPAPRFAQSKKLAIAGCAMALVVWFGGFIVIGGGLFQMWQFDLGRLSLEDAFRYVGVSGIVLLFVNMPDE